MALESSEFHDCLRALLKPIVRFCTRWSIGIQDWIEVSKSAFLEVAEEEMRKKGDNVNVSRLSVATGLRRREVVRIFRDGEKKEPNFSYASRVIGQWQSDPEFTTQAGKPKVLSFEGDESEFRDLVRTVSSDVHPGTILFELERIQAVERGPRGLKLVLQQYSAEHNSLEGYSILASDMDDMIKAAEQNLSRSTRPNLHHTTKFDNISLDKLPALADWILHEGEKFHAKLRDYLARHDQDINLPKKSTPGGGKVSVSTFSLIDPEVPRSRRRN